MTSKSGRPPSQRQLRVGELLRHALSEIIGRGDIRDPALEGTAVTVLEVSVSPDLRHAVAYVMPLGGIRKDEILQALKRSRRFVRGQLAREIKLKFMPDVDFRLDTTFDYSDSVQRLLHDPRVARDLGDPEPEAE
jgi:ribosome-binding factor A